MQFTSQSINHNLLIKTRLSAICLCGLIITGCTSSDDPVEQVNVAPVAVVDDVTVITGSTTPLNPAANDSDADDGLDLASIVIVADPANGTVVVNADGSVTYTHDGSATVSDQFTYNIKDNSGAVSNTASVAITVTETTPAPGNIAPVAVVDAFTVINASTTPFNLVANDSDADDGLDITSIVIVADPANGMVVVNVDGTVNYTHNGSNTASDSFSYTIKDISGAVSNIANVEITVSPPGVQVGIYDSTVVEGADDLEFVISLSAASAETVIVDYTTSNGTALAGTDYSATSGTVQFVPGEVRKFVTVSVLSNTVAQTDTSKNLQLVLSDPQNAQLSIDTGTGTIIDREKMSTDSIFDHNWSPVGVFSGAVICADCHTSNGTIMQFDKTDVSLSTNDISPSTQWKHSVMANAFNDPYWQAAVEDEVDSFPHLSGFIEDTCTKCHAPMGRTHAYHVDPELTEYRMDTARAENHAREGVSCTACHQMQENGTDSGGYIISGDTTNKVIFGPYANPRTNPMLGNTTYTPVNSEHVESSELCASCHTLYTPSLDPDTGAPTGINFLEQGPYLEWQNSVYATGQAQEAQCQDCHMPVPSDTYETVISTRPPGNQLSPRQPFGQHTLVGGNAHLLEILRDYSTELGIANTTSTAGFDDQIALTRNFLGSAAEVAVSTLATDGNNLEFNVEVTNNAGHKIPSAYPSRRVWLHVVVKSAGQTIFESGKPDSRGYISTDIIRLKADCMSAHKLEGFDSSLCYEPHRDVINDQSQVAIYETVLGDVNNNITHTLLQGAKYLKDNRIPPAGFTNSKATTIEPQTVPSGVAGDNDFNCVSSGEGCGKDSVHYQVNTDGQSGPYTVEVSLLYQATQPGFVDGMHNVGDRVNRFKVMYDAVPPSVEVLATASKQ